MRCFRRSRRISKCKKCLLLLLVVVCVVLYGGHIMFVHSTCSEKESHRLVEDLCKLYDKREIAGSFCSHLCHERHLTYNQCTNYRGGKRVIFMTCDEVCEKNDTVKVVFKTKTSLEEREHLPIMFLSDSLSSPKAFRENVYYLLQRSFLDNVGVNIAVDKDPLTFSWGWNFENYLLNNKDSINATYVGADSIFSLVTQYEYALMKLYSNRTYIPKIYGTCGPAYFVEYTQTLSSYEYSLLSQTFLSWKESVNIALMLIDLMQVLDNDFHLPLHLCDIKPDNFGLRQKSQVNLIDVDCAMFEDKLLEQFKYSNCTTHDDCDFFDCRGHCDTTTNMCLHKRTNNNMQSVCEDVFIGLSTKFPTGLLRNPPPHSKVEVFQAIEDCAFPDGKSKHHTVRVPAPFTAVDKLKTVLKKSLLT